MPTHRDTVVFKGNKTDGISIIIDEHASFDQVLARLREKLEPARQFFEGAHVRVRVGHRHLDEQAREALKQTVGEFGLSLSGDDEAPTAAEAPAPCSAARPNNTQLIKRTVRSGQRVDFAGNVVVLGDVNPGAVVTCSGDIIVLGALRGVAHAGCEGDASCCVIALRLEPTQLRIAGFISRAPDGENGRPGVPERAFVRDGVIQVEAYVP